ncbi:MAG: MBL fold metallo-hydrolase [Clostridia bacterium]|nr:MBL fold metallo-hydrolase [Clostridia bacterium]
MTQNKGLNYNILRGEDKIGENLIEIEKAGTKVLLECGTPISPTESTAITEEYIRKEPYSAIIISHFHEDHSGLLRAPLATEAIYMGKVAFAFLQDRGVICEENARKVSFMRSEEPFSVGEITFTPHLCDHSAFDSYMIEVTDGEKTLLYTGDFRRNGRKSFSKLLGRLPAKVDTLICEKTIDSPRNMTEGELEEKAVAIMKEHKEIFLIQSASNLDRAVSFYRACKKTATPFLMTPIHVQTLRHYDTAPNPKTFADVYEYFPRKQSPDVHALEKKKYGEKVIGREAISKLDRFCMMISMNMEDYLQKLAELRDLSDAVVIYSMWSGYKQENEAFFEKLRDLGVQVVDLHTSGHADGGAIEALIERTNPKEIRYVHTEKPKKEKTEMLVFDTDDFLRTYKGKRAFVEGSPYFETFLKSLEDLDLYDKIRFCNDVLQVPPIYTFVKYYKDVFTAELSTAEKQGLGACFGYLFQKIWGYVKSVPVWAGDRRTNIKNASYFLKLEQLNVFHVENADCVLRALIEKQLPKGAPSFEMKKRLEEELAVIEKTDSADLFLFLAKETKWLKERDILFSARGTFYPSFYIAYLLGITEFDPMRCGIEFQTENRVPNIDIDVEENGCATFLKHLLDTYGENLVVSACSVNVMKQSALDEIKKEEQQKGKPNYGAFSDKAVYLAMQDKQFLPPWFTIEEIRKKKPLDLHALTMCTDPIVKVTEKNRAHHMCYAVIYYKLAYLRLLDGE